MQEQLHTDFTNGRFEVIKVVITRLLVTDTSWLLTDLIATLAPDNKHRSVPGLVLTR